MVASSGTFREESEEKDPEAPEIIASLVLDLYVPDLVIGVSLRERQLKFTIKFLSILVN